MRNTKNPIAGRELARVSPMFPVCALIVVFCCSGCGGGKYNPHQQGHNSPIAVADGSMKVRTYATHTPDLGARTLTISGGLACSITDGSGKSITLGSSWTIKSHSGNATITTSNRGATIVATGPDMQSLVDDTIDGPGAEFGKLTVDFTPAELDNPPNTLDCRSHKCIIKYWVDDGCH